MTFHFQDVRADPILARINLRGMAPKQWDHPVKGLIQATDAWKLHRNILALPKLDRERYALSLFALALSKQTNLDWWVARPKSDPPDGLVLTFIDVPGGAKGNVREIEIVEYRGVEESIYDCIYHKLSENTYTKDAVLVCLVLAPGMYDFVNLAERLHAIESTVNHVFLVFTGAMLNSAENTSNEYTVLQLLPKFSRISFSIESMLEDFKAKYDAGEESRIIEEGKIFKATANVSALKK